MTNTLPDRRAYSDRTALFSAQLSMLAYEEFDTDAKKAILANKLEKIEITNLKTVIGQKKMLLSDSRLLVDTQAICVEHHQSGMIFIAFRGTEPDDLTDWLTDIRIKLDDDESGHEIHSGFRAAYDAVQTEVNQWLADAGNKPVIFCGHSLGGALAMLATLRNQNSPPASCYTFGGPKIGKINSDEVKTPIYRLVNDGDPVAKLPPRIPVFGQYKHFGDGFELQEGASKAEPIEKLGPLGRFIGRLESGLEFLEHLSNEGLRDAVRGFIRDKIDSHGKELYVSRLKKIAQARNQN